LKSRSLIATQAIEANQSSPHIGIATGIVGPASPHLPDLKAQDMANRLGVA
jgi:hypothetical protein